MVSVKDIYAQLAAGADVKFKDLMHPPLLVPETQKASVLLETFRRTGNHAAFVVDEFGGVIGMVTLIDLLESIVGDVPSKEERLAMPIRERPDGTWLMDGLIEIEKLGTYLAGFVPPEGGGDEFQTVAGWFVKQLAACPARATTSTQATGISKSSTWTASAWTKSLPPASRHPPSDFPHWSPFRKP